jgi:hypothetical protein
VPPSQLPPASLPLDPLPFPFALVLGLPLSRRFYPRVSLFLFLPSHAPSCPLLFRLLLLHCLLGQPHPSLCRLFNRLPPFFLQPSYPPLFLPVILPISTAANQLPSKLPNPINQHPLPSISSCLDVSAIYFSPRNAAPRGFWPVDAFYLLSPVWELVMAEIRQSWCFRSGQSQPLPRCTPPCMSSVPSSIITILHHSHLTVLQ